MIKQIDTHLATPTLLLSGAALRAEKLRHAQGRDQQRSEEVASVLEQWRERDERCRLSGLTNKRVEERQISLVAQELGIAYPVSVERIERRRGVPSGGSSPNNSARNP